MNNLIPKYYQVKQKILDLIHASELEGEDECLPSERVLCDMFNVSRITVRKAIDDLVQDQILYKIHGKGTFIFKGKKEKNLLALRSNEETIISYGATPNRIVLSKELIGYDEEISGRLKLLLDDKIVKLDRIYSANDVPINRTKSYVPIKYFPGIINVDFEQNSLYHQIEQVYMTKITRSHRTIEAVLANKKNAQYLGVAEGTPILLFKCVTFGLINDRETPIEYFECVYRSDQYKFYIDQVR